MKLNRFFPYKISFDLNSRHFEWIILSHVATQFTIHKGNIAFRKSKFQNLKGCKKYNQDQDKKFVIFHSLLNISCVILL